MISTIRATDLMLFCKSERNWIRRFYIFGGRTWEKSCFSSELYTSFHVSCKYMKYIFQKHIKVEYFSVFFSFVISQLFLLLFISGFSLIVCLLFIGIVHPIMKKEKQFACVIPNSFIYSVNKKKNDDFLNNNTAILFLIYNEATIAIQTIVSKKF